MTDLFSQAGHQLYFVRLIFDDGEFVARVKPSTGGIKGLLVFDSTPSAMVTVIASDPAQAVVQAWEEVRAARSVPTLMAESEEAFAKHIMGSLKQSQEDD